MVRKCKRCGANINHRHLNARYCKACATLREKEYQRNRPEPLNYYGIFKCNECGVILTKENTIPSEAAKRCKLCKSCDNEKDRKRKALIRVRVLERLGNKCVECGFDDTRILQIDHIHAGGNAEWRSHGSTHKYYNRLLSIPLEELKENYQLLCPNHNWLKRVNKKEFGAKYKK